MQQDTQQLDDANNTTQYVQIMQRVQSLTSLPSLFSSELVWRALMMHEHKIRHLHDCSISQTDSRLETGMAAVPGSNE